MFIPLTVTQTYSSVFFSTISLRQNCWVSHLLKPVTVFSDTNQKVNKLEVISPLTDIKCCLMTHRAKSILPAQTCNCPFFPPGKVCRTPLGLSYHQAVVTNEGHLSDCYWKSICAALPSLPHTRVTLSQLNGRFFQNVMQIRNRQAVSTG